MKTPRLFSNLCRWMARVLGVVMIILTVTIVISLAFGCTTNQRAQAMKRTIIMPIDENYLKNIFLASVTNQNAQVALSNSVKQLDEHLAEFHTFMGQVEDGKIAVIKDMKGGWQSYVNNGEYWIFAGYSGELGSVNQFEAHRNRDPFPLIYGFRFNTNGCITFANTITNGFTFDEHGKVRIYYYDEILGQQEERVTMGEDGKIHYESWRAPKLNP